jgi:hypothetical protein
MTTTILSSKPERALDPDICFCCLQRVPLLRHVEAWWQPSPGHGYGQDGRTITLCDECIRSLQFFVELGGAPPRR